MKHNTPAGLKEGFGEREKDRISSLSFIVMSYLPGGACVFELNHTRTSPEDWLHFKMRPDFPIQTPWLMVILYDLPQFNY